MCYWHLLLRIINSTVARTVWNAIRFFWATMFLSFFALFPSLGCENDLLKKKKSKSIVFQTSRKRNFGANIWYIILHLKFWNIYLMGDLNSFSMLLNIFVCNSVSNSTITNVLCNINFRRAYATGQYLCHSCLPVKLNKQIRRNTWCALIFSFTLLYTPSLLLPLLVPLLVPLLALCILHNNCIETNIFHNGDHGISIIHVLCHKRFCQNNKIKYVNVYEMESSSSNNNKIQQYNIHK